MKQLIQAKAPIDKQYEYQLDREGTLYVAGAKKVALDGRVIKGQLYLDRLIRTEKPVTLGPVFSIKDGGLCLVRETIMEKREKRKNEVSIGGVVLADYGWSKEPGNSLDLFVEGIDITLLNKGQKMGREDIAYFFEQVHKHYMEYFL